MTDNSKYQRQKGSASLLILIGVAIMMMLAAIQFKSFFKTPPKPKRPILDINRPWLEADGLLNSEQIISMPEAPKPLLNKAVILVADVSRDQKPRGTIRLEFAGNGEVSGTWNCDYESGNQHYNYIAKFNGNIDIEETYTAEDKTEDESKLFFISKGKYIKTTASLSTTMTSSNDGTIYVTGWMNPDHSASGKITITTDETWSAVYTWQSNGQ